MNTGDNPLENFTGFEDLSDGQDLFSQQVAEEDDDSQDQDDPGQDDGKEEDDDDNPSGKDDKSGKDSKTEEDFFSQFEGQDEEEENDEGEDENKGKKSSSVIDYLKEKGFYNEEEDEGLEEDEVFEKAIEKNVEETFSKLPDIAKQFNRFVIKGGNPEKFFKAVASDYSQPKLSEDMDLTSKDNQELVLKTMLANEGNDQEEIDAQIEYFRDSGKLEKMATKKFDKWKEQKDKRAEELTKQRIAQAQEEKQKLKESRQSLASFLAEKDKVGDIPFTPEDKNSLPSYMVDKNVKLQNGTTITQFQKELYYDLPSNQEAFMQLGVMMRNRNEDGTFNFKAIKEDIESNISGEVKKNIRNSKGKKANTSGSRSTGTQKKSLAEMLG